MFKKILPLIVAFGMVFVLAACSKSSQATATQTSPSVVEFDTSTMTADEKLAIGTLKLEGTDLAVDKEEAATLLPLWKAVRALKADDTISTEEMEALYQQIKDSMTTEQVKAIDAMSLTSDDIKTLTANLGVGFGSAAEQGSASTEGSSGMPQMPSGAEFSFGDSGSSSERTRSGGGFPSGGGAPPSGGEMPSGGVMMFEGRPGEEANQTSQGTGQTAGGRMNNMFIEPLIRLLKERSGS